ncbi:MAG: hypothetical protein HY774_16110 [Acidobacteria bacterium]|nr:hypothetical protein [Acidobacteriota bacterium]
MAKKRNWDQFSTKVPSMKPSGSFQSELLQVKQQAQRGQIQQAYHKAKELAIRFPKQPKIFEFLLEAAVTLKDYPQVLRSSYKLYQLEPHIPENVFNLGVGFYQNSYPGAAYKFISLACQKWPKKFQDENTHKVLALCREAIERTFRTTAVSVEELLEMAAANDHVHFLLANAEWEELEKVVLPYLKKFPHMNSIRNNYTQALRNLNKPGQAIELAESVLKIDPENIHALSNLVVLSLSVGDAAAARAYAARLKEVHSLFTDVLCKQSETLTRLGDDQGVLDVYAKFKSLKPKIDQQIAFHMYHLTAVAQVGVGAIQQAKKLWREAVKHNPAELLYQENLDDLSKPEGERQGPVPFPLNLWLTDSTINALTRAFEAGDSADFSALVNKYPELLHLAPIIFEKCDDHSRELFIDVARQSRNPQMMQAVLNFSTGKAGPDKLRIQAAMAAKEAGFITGEKLQIQTKGAMEEVQIKSYEIHHEPTPSVSPEAEDLAYQAWEALHDNRDQEAERLLRKVIELDPNNPGHQFNLQAAIRKQKRTEEANAMVEKIHQEFPDYFFARLEIGMKLIDQGKLDAAREITAPIQAMTRFHVSEFAMLCVFEMEYALASKNVDAAWHWHKFLKLNSPDHPGVKVYKQKIEMAGFRESFKSIGSKLFPGRGTKKKK